MSLTKLVAKGAKGKQKQLPKLKTILANPSRKKCPTLDAGQLEILQRTLISAVGNSTDEARKYASLNKISLGLESCLRCINNDQSSCVFISLSIKPIHIVSLIARNAEVKDPAQPVYAQPNLEEFTEKLFGIRALCMVLPRDLQTISADLYSWVEQRRNKKLPVVQHRHIAKYLKSNKVKGKVSDKQHSVEENQEEIKSFGPSSVKKLDGDYISFRDSKSGGEEIALKDDSNEAVDALARLMRKIPKLPKPTIMGNQPMDVDDAMGDVPQERELQSDDSVDFLDSYKELIVHKINPNPNKKPKKKRNKNKNKIIKK